MSNPPAAAAGAAGPGPTSSAAVAMRVIRRTDSIDPSPSLLRLEAHLRRGDSNAIRLGKLIEGSPALAARVLRLANSAYYAPRVPVVALNRAVILLGDTMLRQLVLATLITGRQASHRSPRQSLAAARLLGDAVRSAAVCRALADITHIASPDEAFVAGLLHDLGRIYLLDEKDDEYVDHILGLTGLDDLDEELRLRGTTHTEVGRAFADEWHLPEAIKEVLHGHHHPAPRSLGAVVAASDWIVRDLNARSGDDPEAVTEQLGRALELIGVDHDRWAARVPAVVEEYGELLTIFDIAE